jgi:putative membrane protein
VTARPDDARLPLLLAAIVLVALVVSGLHPHDRGTWLAEVAPVFLAAPVLIYTWPRFRLTNLLYVLIAIHALVLIVGGAYTYARVPFGFVLKDWLDLERNPYDRIGHFVQGFVPVLIAREVLLRNRFLTNKAMTAFLCVCCAMTVSALYELIEWLSAVVAGGGAVEFLGTQGDPWDAQGDMLMALIGAIAGLATLSRLHDRQMAQLEAAGRSAGG